MRILLVNTNTYRHLAPAPIGLAYLCEPLIKSGHKVRILDLMFSGSPERDIQAAVQEFKPEVAGFSIRNLDNYSMRDSISFLPAIRRYVRTIRERNIVTVLGGTAFSTFPAEILDYMEANYGLAGQGESSFLSLVDSLADKRIDYTLPGLVYRDRNRIKINPFTHRGYSSLRTDWANMELKNYSGSIIPAAAVIVKTGCPYGCAYCDYHITAGSTYKKQSVDEIIDEIKTSLKWRGVKSFYFIDSAFNTPPDFAKTILETIIQKRIKINFMAEILPVEKCYDDEFFKLYKRAGGNIAIVGGDALSDTMLESYHKPFRVRNIIECSTLLKKNRIIMTCSLLLGGFRETDETIAESLGNLAHVPFTILTIGMGVRLLPDTSFFYEAKKQGLIRGPEELLFPCFYFAPAVDFKRTENLVNLAARRYASRMKAFIPYGLRILKERILKRI